MLETEFMMPLNSEKDIIKAVLLHPARYDLDLLGVLHLRVTDDKIIDMYAEYHDGEVLPSDAHFIEKNHDGSGHIVTYSWDISQADEAVEFFLKIRQEREIGVDIKEKIRLKSMMEELLKPTKDVVEGSSNKDIGNVMVIENDNKSNHKEMVLKMHSEEPGAITAFDFKTEEIVVEVRANGSPCDEDEEGIEKNAICVSISSSYKEEGEDDDTVFIGRGQIIELRDWLNQVLNDSRVL
jgi:hypothetical protein